MLTGSSFIPKTVKKAIILCHGYGANGDDLMGLVPYLANVLPDTAFFAPNAPVQMPFDGYEWFSLNDYNPNDAISIDYLDKLVARCAEPASLLRTYINKIQTEYFLTDGDIILAGFSQGGLLSLYTALTHPFPLAGVVGFSSVPIVFAGILHPASIKRHIPILLTHGTADNVIPVKALDLTVSELKHAGQDPEIFVSEGLTHGIDEACLEKLVEFIQDLFPSK